jgi:hypothetical protein
LCCSPHLTHPHKIKRTAVFQEISLLAKKLCLCGGVYNQEATPSLKQRKRGTDDKPRKKDAEEILLTGKSIHAVFGSLLAVLHLIALAAFAKVEDRSQKEKPHASNEDCWKSRQWERRASEAGLRWRTQSYWKRSQHNQN